MNIAITAGLQLNPPGFGAGLGAWSRENGLSGEPTWSGVPNAAIVPGDQDFGTCMEIVKQADVTRLRFVGETPILPGTYLRVSARVKAIAGNLPQVRIGAWAGTAARVHVDGVAEAGAATALRGYGEIVEVSAIVGVGRRPGVTMSWGRTAQIGHFGIDLVGVNGGAVRIESIRIEDVTAAFLPAGLDWVDVRDFGAVGDGIANDRDAFIAADAAANGGEILVPDGVYFLAADTAIKAPVRFKGRITMPRAARLSLQGRFDFPTYADAFGDETEGLKRALQALFGFTDHTALDLCGRRVDLTEPLDVAAACPGLASFSNRRVICNGQIATVPGAAWKTTAVTSNGTYDPTRPEEIRAVAQVAQIAIGSRVSGAGVGREVYVRDRNVATGTLTLSQPLYGGAGTRSYTFTRESYALDFAALGNIDRLTFADIEFLMDGTGNGVMLPPAGQLWTFRDCFFTRPQSRAITSIGRACQDLVVEQCQFLSDEMGELAQNRRSIAINVNGNDTKIRNSRFVRFGHFMVANGNGHMISGNHWFQGDSATSGVRFAGLVLTSCNLQVNVTGNYVDNATIEWTNEHSAYPNYNPQFYSFGGLTITGNTFLCSNVVPGFSWLVIKPYGTGQFLQGLTVMGNVFKCSVGRVTRIDRVDATIAGLNHASARNVVFSGNSFTGVDTFVANPVTITHAQNTAAAKWVVDTATSLPFGAFALKVDSVIAETPVRGAGGNILSEMPFVSAREGTSQANVGLNWSAPASGRMAVRIRMDNPN